MGQQQLLLVILVTILVGIATVVALNVFGGAATEANRDAVRQDMLQGASAAQALYARPEMMDGAGRNFGNLVDEDDNVLIPRLGMAVTENYGDCIEYGNENGCYSITNVGEHTFTLLGEPATGTPNIEAVITYNTTTNEWGITWDEI